MRNRSLGLAAVSLILALADTPAIAQAPASGAATVLARVNGRAITEQDVRFAEAEIGGDLGTLPDATRRRVLVEYLIENALFAEAAEAEKLGSGQAFDERMNYWRRRALRDAYFDRSVKGSISDAEARKIFDSQVGGAKAEEEVRARHILVDTEQKAKEVFERIAHGADFSQLAKEHTKDPGSKDTGGDLGYFGRGQMVPQFEEAAFKLKKGDVAQPIQSQFGWHIIKLEDRRSKPLPKFEDVKDRLVGSIVHRKAQEIAAGLRQKAKVEFLDADLKAQVEAEVKGGIKPK